MGIEKIEKLSKSKLFSREKELYGFYARVDNINIFHIVKCHFIITFKTDHYIYVHLIYERAIYENPL